VRFTSGPCSPVTAISLTPLIGIVRLLGCV
jgi:hypothetical protein